MIRETIGPRGSSGGCPAGTPLNGIGYFNSYFNGEDDYNSWQGMHAMFSSINANAFLNHMVVYMSPARESRCRPHDRARRRHRRRTPAFLEVARTREDDP